MATQRVRAATSRSPTSRSTTGILLLVGVVMLITAGDVRPTTTAPGDGIVSVQERAR